ncbi:LuxR family transcriptional regulator, maltose regulon positive regulatory protein [Mycetocola miduiensis]|uniref:LuxR family transcriptional regulator, maltose regulon positive regulatory protein n=2 Tax=Mycetocola miduiensis TaxID=995034 RepID=A0A1I5C7F1_9MICO|nr:LuxR family transcriptional regulator, maltose regulon positive regulatory protein [Mycetocola miduiensis]
MPILATKLFVPPLRAQAVRRPRLVQQLDEGLRSGRKLSLLSAPAGFGKTTLLSEWVEALAELRPSLRVAWLSLDTSDNDPVRFLGYLAAALRDPAADPDAAPLASAEAALTALINDLVRTEQQVVLVLDDVQTIESPAVRDAIAFLLDHLPPQLHLVIATRSDPPLPIARLRARGELTELRAADLRFTAEEAATFVTRVTGLSLSPDDVLTLEARTEGWVAGLQLAALSMRDSSDVPGFLTAFAGSHRFVIDYLVEEVLEATRPGVREFLLQTSVLDRLSGPLCDAVTGQAGSDRMLATLERENLFVVPLDDDREWFRYHHLFADVLRARLLAQDPKRVLDLNRLASEWYEQHGSAEDAVRYAFAASDFPLAARLIEATIPGIRKSRQDATLLTWLTQLPADVIGHRPVLGVFSAWASLVAGDIDAVETRLAAAERTLAATSASGQRAHESEPGEELQNLPVTIALYRAAVAQARGDLAGMRENAQRAMDAAAPDDHLGRGAAAGMLGLASWAMGDIEAGIEAFGASSASLRQAGNVTDAINIAMVLVDMLLPLGRLREAQSTCEAALAEAAASGSGAATADLHATLSEILLERNQIAEAKKHLAGGEQLGDGVFSHEHHYRQFVAQAKVAEAENHLDDAYDLLTQAEQHYRRGFFPEARPIGAMKARIRIVQARLPEALEWVNDQSLSPADELSYPSEFGHVTLARLLLAQFRADPTPDAGREASGLLARLREAAEAGGRRGSVIEILVLQALLLEAQGDTAAALDPLEQALVHAEPEGYVRVFVAEGQAVLRPLRAAAGAGIRPEYVRMLSQALRQTEGAETPSAPLSEALSERELHVLRLLSTEMTGPEIANELFVSLNTMRTHTKHIFQKLDVTSRPAAVRRAEALGLI